MVEGDSMRTSVFLQACQEETRRPSNQPRNLELASLRKETVNTPCSMQMRMSSAGSPSTGANSMPWPSIHSRYSAWEAILTVWPSFCRPCHISKFRWGDENLAQSDVGLDIASGSNCQTSKSKTLGRFKRDHGHGAGIKHNCRCFLVRSFSQHRQISL